MNNKNALVVKSNRLVEASYRLTLAEQRIILYAVATSRQTGKMLSADEFVYVAATDYAEMFGLALNQAYEQIKEAAKTLFRRYVVLYERTENGGQWVDEVRWLSSAGYNDGEGRIRLRFSQEMVPYISRLEAQFTRYELEKIANMSSPYAIRLYELLMQWGSVGRREVELGWLKKTLMVDKDYPRLFDFKKWVLDVALSQINEHSDLAASYTQRKTGRNVSHLIFTFGPKEEPAAQPKAQEAPVDARGSALLQRLRGHGIGAKMAAEWIRRDEARALAALEYVETRARQGQVEGSTAGYLRTVFESGSDLGPSAFKAKLKQEAQASKDQARQAEAAQKAKERAKEAATQRAKDRLAALPPEELRAFAEAYHQGEGAELKTWDEKAGRFRATVENLQFKGWLVGKFVKQDLGQ